MANIEDALTALRTHFGFEDFREGQREVIAAILAGHDTVVVMPTGGGKSLCYQLPALMKEGATIVISPLIALMKDQVDALAARNLPATFINSSLTFEEQKERLGGIRRGLYKLVYIAPERFRSAHFVETLKNIEIAFFAVDEAHCISQWGHDFRPDYLRLRDAMAQIGHPQIAALTATATPYVRSDIIEQTRCRVLFAVPVWRASCASVTGPSRSSTSSTSRTAQTPGDAARVLRTACDNGARAAGVAWVDAARARCAG